jgi:predicted phage terminase large subunit-like protein
VSAPTSPAADLARAAWRASPAGYGLKLAPVLPTGFTLWRHTALISREYVRCMSVPGSRLIINVQNQIGKSLLTSILGPAWILDHWPHLRVMLIAHGIDFATKFGRQSRDLVANNPDVFQRAQIVGGQDAATNDWHTTAGGSMFSTSIFRVAGNPADRIQIDDPYASWKDAHSEVVRKSVFEAWESDVQGRIRPETSVCLTMTRYHADDLTGQLTDPKRNPEAKRWRVVRLPALAEPDGDPLGRAEGETIDERCRPRQFMLDRKATTSSYLWAGMYQQRPSPAGGGIIKRSWWKWYTMRPGIARFDEVIASWDMAFKETATSSFVVGQVWGRMGGDFYLLDQVRDRMDFPSTLVAVEALAGKWPMARAKLVEDKANGPAVIATLARRVPGLIAVAVEGSKEARLHAVSPLIEAGNVFLPDPRLAPWIGDFVEELSAFPAGSNSDMVDAASQALQRLTEGVGIQSDYTGQGGRR